MFIYLDTSHVNYDLLYSQVLFHEDGSVKGIATNDVGIAKDGSPKVLNTESAFINRSFCCL